MKNILVLTTGGTIACENGEAGLTPQIDAEGIRRHLGGIADSYALSFKEILNLDSSNIQPEEWIIMAREVYADRTSYDGIVITHGTDTMAYTASMLTFMLPGIGIPVVLTGAQLPIVHPLTDATDNLRYALAMAASGVAGIFVAFDRRIILGCRAVKVRTMGFDAFESVNCPYVGRIDSDGLNLNMAVLGPDHGRRLPDTQQNASPDSDDGCSLKDNICRDVFLLKLIPGIDPKVFDMLADMKYRGIVIEAFGTGGLHYVHRDLISELQKLIEAGVTIVVSSQCLYERSDLSIYETGKMALKNGVIQAYDMTTEAAVTKLMWVLGQTEDPGEVRRLFATDLAGEVTGR